MCGIFGSKYKLAFIDAYNENQKRGCYSYGALYIQSNQQYLLEKLKGKPESTPQNDYDIYLGHTRAPTQGLTEFNPNQSHPFQYGSWIVGHNGILNNFKQLQKRYKFLSTQRVDSIAIPFLLHEYMDGGGEIKAIQKALEEIDGIYGCWAYNFDSNNIYLFRCASSLYYCESTHTFSSAKISDSIELIEGKIYQYKENNLEIVGTFNFISPYFIPE